MKYQNAAFSNYYLVKYNDSFIPKIKNLEEANYLFTSYIKKWPTYMDINSKMQSYMIMNSNSDCLGGLFMYPSTANKANQIINVLLDDKKLTEDNQYLLINDLITFMSEILYNQKEFSINMYNSIDLSDKVFGLKKLYNTDNHISYSFTNQKQNNYQKHLEYK